MPVSWRHSFNSGTLHDKQWLVFRMFVNVVLNGTSAQRRLLTTYVYYTDAYILSYACFLDKDCTFDSNNRPNDCFKFSFHSITCEYKWTYSVRRWLVSFVTTCFVHLTAFRSASGVDSYSQASNFAWPPRPFPSRCVWAVVICQPPPTGFILDATHCKRPPGGRRRRVDCS